MEGTIISLIIAVAAAAIAVWAILDIIRRNMVLNQRIIWIIVVILIPLIGPLTYFMTGRERLN